MYVCVYVYVCVRVYVCVVCARVRVCVWVCVSTTRLVRRDWREDNMFTAVWCSASHTCSRFLIHTHTQTHTQASHCEYATHARSVSHTLSLSFSLSRTHTRTGEPLQPRHIHESYRRMMRQVMSRTLSSKSKYHELYHPNITNSII